MLLFFRGHITSHTETVPEFLENLKAVLLVVLKHNISQKNKVDILHI